MPLISELSAEYHVRGLIYGEGERESLPFPVRQGTRDDKIRYAVDAVPAAVILKDDNVLQVLSGPADLRDVGFFLRAFKKRAGSVSGTVRPRKDVAIVGWVTSEGAYFEKETKFFLTDRRKNIEVVPWLLREAVKSRFKKARPRLMSDVLGKPVMLKGKLTKTEAGLRFEVREDVSLE